MTLNWTLMNSEVHISGTPNKILILKRISKQKQAKLLLRVGSEDSEVVWSCSAAFHGLQQLNTAVGHWQHLHACSYTTLHTHGRHTHTSLIKKKMAHSAVFMPWAFTTLTDAGNKREKYISHVSLAAVTIVFFTCSSTGSMFCWTPCLSAIHTFKLMNVREMCLRPEKCLQEEQTDYRRELSLSAFHPGWCEHTPLTECRSQSAGDDREEDGGEVMLEII